MYREGGGGQELGTGLRTSEGKPPAGPHIMYERWEVRAVLNPRCHYLPLTRLILGLRVGRTHVYFHTCWLIRPPPPALLHLSPDLSKITRRKQHFDHQLGRLPTVAVYKENPHKFYLHVLHSPPEIHHTYLKGEALTQLVLI